MPDVKQHAEDSLLYLVINNARHAKRLIKRSLSGKWEAGIDAPMNLLTQIDFDGNTLVELTRRLKCSKQEVSRVVQQAQEQGWVELTVTPADRRAKLVCISKQGREYLYKGFDLYSTIENEIMTHLNKSEKEALVSASKKIQQLLNQNLV